MYWSEKYSKQIDTCLKFTGLSALIPLIIWVLNGGKNNFGIIHHVVIYTTFSTILTALLLLVIIIIFAIHDSSKWIMSKMKN